MDFEDFKPLYISESHDNLTVFEDNLVKLTADADDELVNTLFRAIHSIKGGAGMFDAPRLIEVAHITESTLDKVREGKLSPNDDLIDTFFQAKDVIETYLQDLEQGNDNQDPRESELLVKLKGYCNNQPPTPTPTPTPAPTQTTEQTSTESASIFPTDSNCLTIEIDQQAFMMGFRLEPLLMDVENSHQMLSLDIDYGGPDFTELNPIECHMSVKMVLTPAMDEEALDDLLSFSAGAEGHLSIVPTEEEMVDGADEPAIEPIVESQQSTPNEAKAPANEPVAQTTNNANKAKGELIKVNSLKLDRVVDDVGEMITLKSQLKAILQDHKDKRLHRLLKEFDKSMNDLRDTSLALRLIPLHETLARFHRVVREAAKVTQKSIHLEIIGGQTELDRVTVEKLVDPLTHIVRNSCDHGIEPSEDRQANGKEATGNITILAQYKGSGVSLKIMDDGKGLDKERILKKAISSGVVGELDQLNDREIYQLIFHPGLSTAEKVTDLSGRGVGMDVVRRNINQLGGDILIDSKPNEGTTIDIRLPLTTAILDGFLIKVGDADLVVHIDSIIECMRRQELKSRMVGKQSCIELRGEYIPVIRLSHYLGLIEREHEPEGLLVSTQQGKVVLAVDFLVGEIQTVVKPLDVILKRSELFSGIIKVAEGDIGFVLDINKLAYSIEIDKNTQFSSQKL